MPRKNGADETPPTDGGPGHNVGGIAGDRLRSFIEHIERLEEEKRATAEDIKEVFAEAKGAGFDTKVMRLIIKERRMDADDLAEQRTILDIYRDALGMFVDTPLGAAAMASVDKAAARAKPVVSPTQPHEIARQTGLADGIAGVRDHAARWPQGEFGAADYEMGWVDGQSQRVERMTDISGA